MTDDVFERRTRRFIEALEILNDLGAHVVAKLGAAPVDRYRDVPTHLLAAGSLTEQQAHLWRRVIGFRNVGLHDCLDVDRDIVQHRLDDLRDLHRAIVAARQSTE